LSDDPSARLLDAFDRQVGWCSAGASPFSARVLALTRDWLARGAEAQPVLQALVAVHADPLAAATSLRWLGALHHLALRGLQPWATLWPPATVTADDTTLTAALAAAWRDHEPALRAALARPPQTNEVLRSAALLPGLLHLAATLQRPLHLAEIGASAGLNLWCDRYRHAPRAAEGGEAAKAWAWGPADAALVLTTEWRGSGPPVEAPLAIARRAGCDAAPLDLAQPGEDLRLASFVWADQHERLARLRAAIAVVRPLLATHTPVQAMQAVDFVRAQLAQRHEGEAFVLVHSVVWQYIAAPEQSAITALMHEAGERATAAAPLAWLRFEPPRPDLRVELRCTTWPGGEDRLLAEAHPHGAWVHWRADTPATPAAVAASAA
jgi:hypothetical protein